MIAYLTRGRGNRSQILKEIRESPSLGPKMANWLEKNEAKLRDHPLLKPKPPEAAPMAQSAHPVKPRSGPALTPSQLRAERQGPKPDVNDKKSHRRSNPKREPGQGLTGKGWSFNPDRDIDLRGQNSTWLTGVDAAFKRIESMSGISRDQFKPTKKAYTQDGKSVVVEWEGPKGSNVNLDIPTLQIGEHGLPKGPTQPHIGWKAPGKLANGRGHVFVDGDLPATRTRADIPDLEF